MITEQEVELARRVIELHDGKSYSLLQEMSTPPIIPDDGFITEEMYLNMCNDIEKELGDVSSIETIDCLMRKESKLTLWRVNYSDYKYDVFWAIGFELATSKVQDVLIEW